MPKHDRIKRRRKQLFEEQKGLCHWCQRKMYMPEKYLASQAGRQPRRDLCTLDHLFHRKHPRRQHVFPGENRLVAACLDCNEKRGLEDERAYSTSRSSLPNHQTRS